MMDQAPVLMIVVPVFASLVLTLIGPLGHRAAYGLLLISMAGSLSAALATLVRVVQTGQAVHYRMGDWAPPMGIELVIDHLSAGILVLISACALLTAIYSMHTARQDNPDRLNHYYALFALLVAGLMGMTAAGDLFNLYVLLEISAISSYGLLARGKGKAYYATFRYLIMGTIGASFYLFGVGYIYIMTGSLNMADLSDILSRPELKDRFYPDHSRGLDQDGPVSPPCLAAQCLQPGRHHHCLPHCPAYDQGQCLYYAPGHVHGVFR